MAAAITLRFRSNGRLFLQFACTTGEAMDIVCQFVNQMFQFVDRINHHYLIGQWVEVDIKSSWQFFRNIFADTSDREKMGQFRSLCLYIMMEHTEIFPWHRRNFRLHNTIVDNPNLDMVEQPSCPDRILDVPALSTMSVATHRTRTTVRLHML